MTDSTAPAKAPKAKTVLDDMAARSLFASVADASAYLNRCNDTLSDFGSTPFASVGIDDEGNFDPAIYTDGMQVMVSTLRKKGKAGQEGTIKAVVVTAIPTLDSLLSDDAGTDWVKRIIEKELNHVAVRALRDAEDITTVVDQMPTTREAYISSARDAGGGIMAAFDEMYKDILSVMSKNSKVWEKTKLSKNELKKGLESAGYALEYYSQLEDRGEGKDSLFKVALQMAIIGAKKKGFDPTIYERWMSTRDAKTFNAADEDEDDFDFDSLADAMAADKPEPKVEELAQEPAEPTAETITE